MLVILPVLVGEPFHVLRVARLTVVIFSCVAVYQGRAWVRWVLVLSVGVAGGYAVLQLFNGSIALFWRLILGVLGARILWYLWVIFYSPEARGYFGGTALPHDGTASN